MFTGLQSVLIFIWSCYFQAWHLELLHWTPPWDIPAHRSLMSGLLHLKMEWMLCAASWPVYPCRLATAVAGAPFACQMDDQISICLIMLHTERFISWPSRQSLF